MTAQVRGIDQNAKFLPGSCSVSSPEKIHSGFTEEVNPELSFRIDLEINGGTPLNKISFSSCLIQTPNKAEEGIGEQSNTPSTTTPPIQTSISPEILCGSSLISTPACFAAGYVVVGVSDKRKCRPRGILTVGGVLESGVNNENFGFSLNACVDSVVSVAPPLVDASMHWLSPPSESIGKGIDGNGSPEFELSDVAITAEEASVHWLVSPCDEAGEDGIHGNVSAISVSEAAMHSPGLEVRGTPASSVNEFGGLVSPMTTVVESTPSPGHGFWRNRTIDSNSGGTMSPSCWPGCKAIVESSSPLTGGIGDENVICTPSSDSDTNNRSGLACEDEVGRLDQQLELASTREALQTISLSMHSGAVKNSSIEFSIDLTQFQSSGQDEMNRIGGLGGTERSMSSFGFDTENNLRVSWREGLVSRIFEVDELSCCRWLSDGEEDVDCLENGDVQSDFQFHISPNVCTSASKCSFGSIEIVNGETGDSEIETKRPPPLGPISCVESISTEGGGLVASDDSDWTLCYKNHLFEV
ncbi:hypothetical protein QJS10_CPA06g01507 [Acorus calamus]|uniref:Uncharacterized protein n=1 Tax=Acorus calamus TaxID=4465 RepID=A0AAV9ENH5_ACOCL|nr:hypothetical protein QJS10_CPA06g01507 [Acorus calamus]